MPAANTLIRDPEVAMNYDEQASRTNWRCPEVVFGLAYEFVTPGQSVLDLGIGSGLSSALFHRAGLAVYGLDGSPEILRVCQAKGFAVELKLHDLACMPLPYPSDSFDLVLCVGVLNSFEDLGPLFGQVARVAKRSGIFAFTVEDQKPGESGSYAMNREDLSQGPQENAVRLYRHSNAYLSQILGANSMRILKHLEFVAFRYPAENRNVMFTAYVAEQVEQVVQHNPY